MHPDAAKIPASRGRLPFPPQRWTIALANGANASVWADSMGHRADVEFQQLMEREGVRYLAPVAVFVRGSYLEWTEPAENDTGDIEYNPRAWTVSEESHQAIDFAGECWLRGQSLHIWEVTMTDASVALISADAWTLEESTYRFVNEAQDASGPLHLEVVAIPAMVVRAVRRVSSGDGSHADRLAG